MFEFFMSVLGGILVHFITKKFDLELYVKLLVFLPKKMAIKIRWEHGRDLVHRSTSSFLVLDFKSSLFYQFLTFLGLLVIAWLMLLNMDFSRAIPGTIVNENTILTLNQMKSFFGVFTICFSFYCQLMLIRFNNEYSLVRCHYLKKENIGLRG